MRPAPRAQPDSIPSRRDPSAPPAARDRVRIGVAGWSYADWRGIVYPQPRPAGFSELRYLAEHLDVIEINSTFYREFPASTAERWRETVRGLPDFSFTAKAHKDLTHSKAPDLDALRDLCTRFTESLRPLSESGLLSGVLLQFPWYFDDCPAHRDRLSLLAEQLSELTLFVELRHTSFLDPSPTGGLPFLETLALNFTNIDLPRAQTLPRLTSINTGGVGYFRLHGRNQKSWFDRQAGRDQKYDYLYSLSELEQMVPLVENVADRTLSTYVITNNHFRGQAVANALQLQHLLGGAPKNDAPDDLQKEFPFLSSAPAEGSS